MRFLALRMQILFSFKVYSLKVCLLPTLRSASLLPNPSNHRYHMNPFLNSIELKMQVAAGSGGERIHLMKIPLSVNRLVMSQDYYLYNSYIQKV